MGNVKYIPRDELCKNSRMIVDTFDYASDECCFPVTIDDFNPTTEEIVAGIKYVIDSGWIGRANIFARRVELKNEFGQVVQGVMLTEDETDFTYDEKNGYSKMLREYPTVIGFPKESVNASESNRLDGDVYLKVSFGHYVSPAEWKEKASQRSRH